MDEYKIKWSRWITVILAIPIVVWILTFIPMPYFPKGCIVNETHWVGFFGGYAGSCIAIIMTLHVMRSTLRQNQQYHINTVNANEELNRKQQQLQINIIRYTQEQCSIEKLRDILDENYKLIDFQKFTVAYNYIMYGNLSYANQLLRTIIRDVEMAGAKTDLYLSPLKANQSIEEKEYREYFNNMMIDYGILINDFIFIISLLAKKQNGELQSLGQIEQFTRYAYDMLKNNATMNEGVREAYNKRENIFEKILHLLFEQKTKDIWLEMDALISERLNDGNLIHRRKVEFAAKTQALLLYKETEIENILLENKD